MKHLSHLLVLNSLRTLSARMGGVCVLFLITICLLLSCNLEDGRDECCMDYDTVRFRYLYHGNDSFMDYIEQVRYFLFDGEGGYLGEMRPREDAMNKVSIAALSTGGYTLVAVGNLDDYASVCGHADGGLREFRLAVNHLHASGEAFANGDRLYWGECAFSIVPDAPNNYLGEMSNVHCVLTVRVEWERLPQYDSGYRFVLDGIGTGMRFCGDGAPAIGVQKFPEVHGCHGRMCEEVVLRRFALQAGLVTLRWSDNTIPCFRLYHGDEAVTKAVDLGMVFERWGWKPSMVPVQEYKIRMLIKSDGSIEVNVGLSSGVNDWDDGGVLG